MEDYNKETAEAVTKTCEKIMKELVLALKDINKFISAKCPTCGGTEGIHRKDCSTKAKYW